MRHFLKFLLRFRVAQYGAELMVWPLGTNSTRRAPFRFPPHPKKPVAMTFRVDKVCLNCMGFDGEGE
jgi:hypothetical protein